MKEITYCFKIGDIVRIKESSQYYIQGDICNPIYMNGTITDFDDDDDTIVVLWDNGEDNYYETQDLELVNAKSVKEVDKVSTSLNRKRLFI